MVPPSSSNSNLTNSTSSGASVLIFLTLDYFEFGKELNFELTREVRIFVSLNIGPVALLVTLLSIT